MFAIIDLNNWENNSSELIVCADLLFTNREELISKLYLNNKPSDEALLIHAYNKWGEDCLPYLKGDFSFAIIDPKKRKVFCGRDRFGQKPFYYYKKNQFLLISNDIAPIKNNPLFSFELNQYFAGLLLSMRWLDPEQTLYKDIFRLAPGSGMRFDTKGPKIWKYWQPEPKGLLNYKNESDYVDQAVEILERAVSHRLRPEKTGVLLSGGVDSPAIMKIIEKNFTKKTGSDSSKSLCSITSFAEMPGCDERESVQKFLVGSKWVHHEFKIEGHAPELKIPKDSKYEDAFYTPTMFTDKLSFKLAQELGIKSIFTGFGGDDLFSPDYYSAQFLREGKLIKAIDSAQFQRELGQSFLNTIWSEGVRPQLVNFRNKINLKLITRPKSVWLNSELDRHLHITESIDEAYTSKNHFNQNFCHNNIYRRFYLNNSYAWATEQQHALAKPFGVNLVHPLYDTELFEFALRLPVGLFYKNGHSKYILRKVSEKYLPQSMSWQQNLTNYAEIENRALYGQKSYINDLLQQFFRRDLGILDLKLIKDLKDNCFKPELRYPLHFILNLEKLINSFEKQETPYEEIRPEKTL